MGMQVRGICSLKFVQGEVSLVSVFCVGTY